MKKFPYKFTTTIKVVFTLFFILAIGVIALNVVKFIKDEFRDTYSYVTLISCVSIAIFSIVIAISLIFASYFMIDDENLTLRWGILKNTIKISTITKLVKAETTNKLYVYYGDEEFMVVFIDPDIFDDFCAFMLTKNKNIIIEHTEK